jgi:hypothetical protein
MSMAHGLEVAGAVRGDHRLPNMSLTFRGKQMPGRKGLRGF